ncbi:tyrosine-type recombinase/integrase [Paenibacillus lautus]|uniref:tyrosine-type recombinase/integrase n=1 Tax=Paenibacillus lautus TaxID=1401 RepID=UPI003D9AAD64
MRGWKCEIKAYCSQVHRFHTFVQQQNYGMGHENMIQSYSLHLLHRKCSHSYVKQALSAIKFYAQKVLLHEETVSYVRPKKEKKLPNVLSMNEVMLILKALHNVKHRAILYLTYSSGLRVGEVVRLKTQDIDFERKTLRVSQGKRSKGSSYAIIRHSYGYGSTVFTTRKAREMDVPRSTPRSPYNGTNGSKSVRRIKSPLDQLEEEIPGEKS